jgi:hypothetical protein
LIEAKPTKYKGTLFRSRLEARWAVVFDELGIRYQYEPKIFHYGLVTYLPDFYLPGYDRWIEIKALKALTRGEATKVLEFGKRHKNYYIAGSDFRSLRFEYYTISFGRIKLVKGIEWSHCRKCRRIDLRIVIRIDDVPRTYCQRCNELVIGNSSQIVAYALLMAKEYYFTENKI